MQEFDTIETPENVELELPLAGIGSRFIAGLIDKLILGSVMFVVVLIAVLAGGTATLASVFEAGVWVMVLLTLVTFLSMWGYFFGFEYFLHGQTPGKRIMRIRVVTEGGQPLGLVEVAVRNLLRVVDGMGMYIVAGVAMFWSSRVQRLGDLAAGTIVVSEQPLDYASRSDERVSMEWESELTAEGLRATGLSPQELRALGNYWKRRDQLTLEARERVLPRLVEPILERSGVGLRDRSLGAYEDYVQGLLQAARRAEGGPRSVR